jgi:hypothetical protein
MSIVALSPPLHDPLPKLVRANHYMNLRALDRCFEIAHTPRASHLWRASRCTEVSERILTGLGDVRAVL